MRLFLAIQCFFAVLFGRSLPPRALPAPEEPAEKRQERERLAAELKEARAREAALEAELKDARERGAALEGELDAARAARDAAVRAEEGGREALAGAEAGATEARARVAELEEAARALERKVKEAREAGALALLGWLQREGRLIDFLMEGIEDYDDAEVGAAVRAIHQGCRKVLQQGLELEPILAGEEEAPVTVEAGFDPVAVQLSGKVKGEPPFKGRLMHHGWRTLKVAVPVPEHVDPHVLAPAEVEL